MTKKKPVRVPFGKTPPIIAQQPKPPDRITKAGLVQLADPPEISGKDLTVEGAISQVVKALTEEAGEEDTLPLQTVLNWLLFIQETAEYIKEEG